MKPPHDSRLVVLLPPRRDFAGSAGFDSGTPLDYLLQRGASLEAGRAPLTALPAAARLELAFDAADVFCAAVEAPPLSEARLRLALPGLLEERLLAEPADQHLAFAPRRAPDGRLPVAAVSRAWLARVLEVFAAAGRTPAAAWSSLYLVPAPSEGSVSLWRSTSRAVLRSAPHEGLGCATDEAPTVTALAQARLGATRLRLWGGALPAPELPGVTIERAGLLDPTASADAIDLLQGSFAPRGWLRRIDARAWRAPLGWAAVAAVVAIAGINLYWLKLDRESRELRTGMVSAFRSAFPRETAVLDPIAQARRQLADLRARAGLASASDFSVLNARMAQLLAQAPVGAVEAMEYRDGQLTVKLKPALASDAALINNLRASAQAQGIDLAVEADGQLRIR